MKTTFSISVKKPCTERFEEFIKTAKGGFCTSCEKEVIDFTEMSQTELMDSLCTTSASTYGRFKNSQIDSYQNNVDTIKNPKFLTTGIGTMSFLLLVFCAVSNMTAQQTSDLKTNQQTEIGTTQKSEFIGGTIQESYTVNGTVVDEDNLPLAGVNVVLKGTADGITTDFYGKFEYPKTLEIGNVLIFSYIGYDTKEYEVNSSNSKIININIAFNDADIELMGEVVVDGIYTTKRTIFQKFIDIFKK